MSDHSHFRPRLKKARGQTLQPAARFRKPMTRREFASLSAGAALSLLLSGCGGGDNTTGNSNNTGGGVPIAPGRTVPTGDLKNQITQYSQQMDQVTAMWMSQDPDLVALSAVTRSAGRATVTATDYTMGVFKGLRGFRIIYGILSQQALLLDDVSALSETVTKNNKLQGTADVTNPLWVAAMMDRNIAALSLIGTILETFQILGLNEMVQLVQKETDPTQQIVNYAWLSAAFNGWVGRLSAQAFLPVDPTWLLDTSATVTNAIALQEVARIDTILLDLPYGPGGRAVSEAIPSRAGTRAEPPPDQPLNDIPKGLLEGFLEELGKLAREAGTDAEEAFSHPEKWFTGQDPELIINPTALVKELINSLKKGVLEELLNLAAKSALKAAGVPELVDCLFELLIDGLSLAKVGSGVVAALSAGLVPLAILLAALAAIDINALLPKLQHCYDVLLAALPQTDDDKKTKIKTPFFRLTATIVDTPRRVKVIPIPGPETDQLKRTRTKRVHAQIIPRRKKAPPVELRAVQGKLSDYVDTSRTTLDVSAQASSQNVSGVVGHVDSSGNFTASKAAITGHIPFYNTYENIELAANLLLLGLFDRNPTILQAQVGSDTIDFFESDLGIAIRRQPGDTTMDVPSITDAQLLCTSPGFIPKRNIAPMDLTSIAQLPPLQPISGISPGGNINVQ